MSTHLGTSIGCGISASTQQVPGVGSSRQLTRGKMQATTSLIIKTNVIVPPFTMIYR